ncbi:MAG: DNA repair protein RecN [bacterium]|nr:DNA repair protein RecN [bacterium]
MIRSLRIDNFALIEQAQIRFQSGFTVITGETGSGKSILLNALQLILGERANFQVIGTTRDKSVVEAEIDITHFNIKTFFEENELDYFDTTIVRREIYKQGRSRAFINDIPVQLNVLKQFSSKLIHIHSQYNTLELKDKEYQLRLLDVLSGNLEARNSYSSKFRSHQETKRRLSSLQESYAEAAQKQDYNSFQLEEIQALQLEATDYEQMQSKLNQAENAQDIQAAYAAIIEAIDGESGLDDLMNRLLSTGLQDIKGDVRLEEFKSRLKSVRIELKDISSDAESGMETEDLDPEQLAVLAEKMDAFNKVLFKHRLQNQEQLLELERELTGSNKSLDDLKEEMDQLESSLKREEEELKSLAAALHKHRLTHAPKISEAIRASLDALKLPDTVLEFQLTKSSELTKWGSSQLEILFSPNKGIPAVPIHAAASGGELSRVMLALQNLLSKKEQLQTVLFDEIDTGVSGDVAQKMGQLLQNMGESMQVIAITHLPQVAAKGGQHLSVRKETINDVTRTFIQELDEKERLLETARLMSGDQINEAALENARALMSQ